MVTNRSITVHYITVPKRLKMRIRILDLLVNTGLGVSMDM